MLSNFWGSQNSLLYNRTQSHMQWALWQLSLHDPITTKKCPGQDNTQTYTYTKVIVFLKWQSCNYPNCWFKFALVGTKVNLSILRWLKLGIYFDERIRL